jgi:chitinase
MKFSSISPLKKIGALAMLPLFFVSTANAALTLYTTGWSMYGTTPYEYDGAYKNGRPYGQLAYVSNPEMVAQFNRADVVAYSFFQVWNSKDSNQAAYQIPASWDGLMHFSDLWAELPLEGSWIIPLPPETQPFLTFCKKTIADPNREAACSAVQLDGNDNRVKLFNYADRKGVGQLNSFGAFINSTQYKAKRIIAIGGANTPENKNIGMRTFEAIFANKDKFLNQFKSWMTTFKNLKGIDYDFEPPIDAAGGQIPPNAQTKEDYKNLLELVQKSRAILGAEAYISVTITVNKEYLEAINQSADGGWFKAISTVANSVNLMTYDLHGPWSQASDPYTSIHAFIKQPVTAHKDEFAINYATDEITQQVLGYGMPPSKLQVGIAAYGRGYKGVAVGENHTLPGFEQKWTGPSSFAATYTNQDGLLPYKAVDRVVAELGYQIYHVKALDAQQHAFVTGSYLYSPLSQQFVGYQSPETVQSLCDFVKAKQLHGTILWSADTDLPVSNPKSLVASYQSRGC